MEKSFTEMKTIVVGVAFALGLVSPMLAQQDDTIYTTGNDVSRPKLIRDVKPSYPAGAMLRRVTGAVLLRCVVDRDGVPTNLEIIEPLDEEIDRVALEALKQWRFEPGKKSGKAVLVQIHVKMAFSMDQKQTIWRRMWRGVAGRAGASRVIQVPSGD